MNSLLLSLALAVTPAPQAVDMAAGECRLATVPSLSIAGAEQADSLRLARYASEHGFSVPRGKSKTNIRMVVSENAAPAEGYKMTVGKKFIEISAADGAGLFYGLQALMDLRDEHADGRIPCMTVTDYPRMPYRGMMLDVSRHYRSKDFILKQIRAMERLNLNRLHLHLTDAAGWRIESERYPRLNTVASFRPDSTWKEWNANGNQYGGTHGGFLSKEELREIVDYAADRFITVVPEVEMPSHSEEVLAAYPLLSCNKTGRGNSNFCASSEATFEFLRGVLDEVMEIFPSEQIHIGGDEAPKGQWLGCPDCRALMDSLGYDSPDYLQSRLIRRMEEYLASRGRRAIVWDDALEGDGPTDNATVMSWRGTEPSSVSLPVIMSPGRFCYLDSYQDAPSTQPEAIGGYTPIEFVYRYEPDTAAVGLQGNLWCEYIPSDSHAEYMLYPRMLAIAENAWTEPQRKDYADFRQRALKESERMRSEGFTVFDLTTEKGNRPEALEPVEHLARGCEVTYLQPYWQNYPAAGPQTLVDGVCGGWNYSDRLWQGFAQSTPERVDVIIDLGAEKPVSSVGATFMQICQPDVWMPERVEIYAGNDPENLVMLREIDRVRTPDTAVSFETFGWDGNVTARYVRYRATAPSGGVLFTDEIVVK